jgi:hypothetical protein
MACIALPADSGAFLVTNPWESTQTKTFDGKTVTLTTSGPNPAWRLRRAPARISIRS